MKILIRYIIPGLILAAIISYFVFGPKVQRLLAVKSLFDADKIVHNFSNMEDLMFSARIEKSGAPTVWPVNLQPLPDSYTTDGETRSVQDWLTETDTTSLLVLKDGEIVFEEYYLGTGQQDLRISWSMAKSYLSAVFGIYVENGTLDLSAPITDYVPELEDSAYDGVPVIDILQMSSGVSFNEDYMDPDSDINRMGRVLALGQSMGDFAASLKERDRPSGEARHYVSIDTHVAAMALENATGKSLIQLFDEHLWSKLGTEGDAIYLTDKQGTAFALGGLNMQTRDYARFGELFRLNGNWNGEQLIPADWVAESTAASAKPSTEAFDMLGYGYQWWVPVNSDGEYNAGGIYGQYIYINPKAGVVVVKTSADREFMDEFHGSVPKKIITTDMFRAIAAHYSDWGAPE